MDVLLLVGLDGAWLAGDLAAQHVLPLDAAHQQPHVVARLPLIQALLEHLHACAHQPHERLRCVRVACREVNQPCRYFQLFSQFTILALSRTITGVLPFTACAMCSR